MPCPSFALGTWLKNQRAAAKKTRTNAALRADSTTGVSYAGELPESRMEALTDIDPGWAPEWEIGWQRTYRLVLAHRKAGGELPTRAGDVVVQGEDLGAWITAQRTGWERLVPVQQYLLETVGIEPLEDGETAGPVRRTQADKWAANLAALRQFHAREGHARVPRKAVETVDGVELRIGAFLSNARSRAAKLSPQRRGELAALGLEWAAEGGA
ncbi:helicase associated domain-containing protein [Streptomyces sp. NPDC090106]|uniref:helicase associated domain-containing protein n=1 Tax=Streptomyces sp. NPDC090106 TaxID=3365946 RepID=UPI00380EE218